MEYISAAFTAQAPVSPVPKPMPILPLTALDTLTRWADAPIPNYDDGDAASTPESSAASSSPSGSIQFGVAPALNHKLILMQGDILGLKVDAVVNSTNERLSDFHLSTLATRLCGYAGPDFQEECQALVRNENGVATGDSSIMSSHGLGKLHGGARWVIHTVSPKYSAKYQTAAENALHGCVRRSLELLLDQGGHTIAFPLITTQRKLYPPEQAAHISFRTLRKFLDRYGEKSITSVVICLQEGTAAASSRTPEQISNEDEVFKLYQRILPLYFPRSEREAAEQLHHLPKETGNELGETVVEERSIRIAYGQFIASGPKPFSPDEREAHMQQQRAASTAAASSAEHASSTATATSAASSSSSSSRSNSISSSSIPSSSFLRPSKTEYLAASEMPVEPDRSRLPPAITTPAIVYTDSSSFSAAQENPDAARLRQYITASSSYERQLEQKENHNYFQLLKRAQSCQHADMTVLDSANYIYQDPRLDILGRRVIHVVGHRAPLYGPDGTPTVSREHFTDHVLRTLDPLSLHPFILIYYHAGVDHTNRLDVGWFRNMYATFTRSQKANLKKLIVVHPSLYLRSALYVGASFVSQSFWSNLSYAYKLADLQAQHLDARALTIPPHVLRHDRATNGVTPLTANIDTPRPEEEVGL